MAEQVQPVHKVALDQLVQQVYKVETVQQVCKANITIVNIINSKIHLLMLTMHTVH